MRVPVAVLRAAFLIGIGAALGACAQLAADLDGDRPVPFPECANVELAFFAENATLADIGLADQAGLEANRAGTIWVTAEPPAPGVIGGPMGGPAMPPQRWVCVEWPDGSGMGMSIDDSWVPPGGIGVLSAPSDGTGWVTIVAVAAVALVLGGVSYLAFRREPTS